MADTEHKFRHLIQPGSNFQFVAKFRMWIILSMVLMAASIGSLFVNKAVRGGYMNWTIDFKGGTEIVYTFKNKADGHYAQADIHAVREALAKDGDFEVSEMAWDKDANTKVNGMIVRTLRYGAVPAADQEKSVKALETAFADRQLDKVSWSGDHVIVKSRKPIDEAAAKAALATANLDMKPWGEEGKLFAAADPNSGQYVATLAVWGLDRQFAKTIETAMPQYTVEVEQSYGVGAKAGDKLRNDAAKSLIYAVFLIMLYLAFRFDIRYAPGAAFATIHDAVMVIGVFAVTWTEVSLTSVAAILTVIGYSVNDTVIVFDRIRENQAKLKDKKLEKIIDISINEMLVRTVLTSMTVFVVTLAMNILGDGLIRNFAFAMNIGVIVGTYSSIFLAAPVFMYMSKKYYASPTAGRGARAAAVAAEP